MAKRSKKGAKEFKRKEDIEFLETLREKIDEYLFLGVAPSTDPIFGEDLKKIYQMRQALKDERFKELRKEISEMTPRARELLNECNVNRTLTQYPPGITGGPILHWSLLDLLLNNQSSRAIPKSIFLDTIDQAIGVLKTKPARKKSQEEEEAKKEKIVINTGFVFIAMPMDPSEPLLEDTHKTIKRIAAENQLSAERVDDRETTEPITPRILESLKTAEYVLADLTFSKQNVYFEAGYAIGYGKKTIFIAKEGTKIEFDLKDYPVIFFKNQTELEKKLDKRFKGLKGEKE